MISFSIIKENGEVKHEKTGLRERRPVLFLSLTSSVATLLSMAGEVF